MTALVKHTRAVVAIIDELHCLRCFAKDHRPEIKEKCKNLKEKLLMYEVDHHDAWVAAGNILNGTLRWEDL